MATGKKESKVATDVTKFSKEQWLHSQQFAEHQDLLHVLLVADQQYSVDEVKQAIQNFMEGVK